ncbi:MAG: hypothetical protein LBG12_04865 [Synergistaceae bacterium]|jgi:hypothetical protein|nr:hypothetical protein [Synergistaceae bacterium]
MDFDTYVLQAHWNTQDHAGWLDGIDERERAEIEQNYYDAAVFSAVEVVHISTPSAFRLVDHMNRVKSDYVSYSMYE